MLDLRADFPVRELKLRRAERDAQRRLVDPYLYDTSATYRDALDGLLVRGGSFVAEVAPGRYEVRSRA